MFLQRSFFWHNELRTLYSSMHFVSTRGKTPPMKLSEAVLQGLSSDGGLFFPEHIPLLSAKELQKIFQEKDFTKIAQKIFSHFTDSFSSQEQESFCHNAYGNGFDDKKISPVSKLFDDLFLLELFHGPTGAFKDFALQFLPSLLHASIKKEHGMHQCILVATSGDTGGAALAGFANIPHTSCLVFFPKGGVSPLQKAQMQSAQGDNLQTIEFEGDFDDLQMAMKAIFADSTFLDSLEKRFKTHISSANSINIGRLLPQVFYPFAAYGQMLRSGEIKPGELIDIVIPTGNFGDMFAALIAKEMGCPLGKLICATNANSATAELIETGIFSLQGKKTKKTLSPAMDISRASNIERLLFWASNENANQVQSWQNDLLKTGEFTLDDASFAKIQKYFSAVSISDEETKISIQEVFQERKYLLDPHTAVGYAAWKKKKGKRKSLLFSTAHYAKFGKTVFEALFPEKPCPKTEQEILVALQKVAQKPHLPQKFFDDLSREKKHHASLSGDLSVIKKIVKDFIEEQNHQ